MFSQSMASMLTLLLWMRAWTWTWAQRQEEIFLSDRQPTLRWTSEPPKHWRETRMFLGTMVPVLQACRPDSLTRTIRSPLMERKGARHLLMDITFTQEAEPDGQLRPLHVYLSTSDSRSKLSQPVAELQTTEPFPQESSTQQVFRYLRNRTALELGPVPMQGFQLAFSYSGTCVFITSIRLYYRKCPDISDKLVSFRGTAAGSASVAGSCMEGVVEVSPPVRECAANGSWGPLRGRCSCQPGHQIADGSCRACRMGYYKPAPEEEEEEEGGGCRPCPENTRTHEEGSVMCSCIQGFSRLPTDPHDLGCTKPPSAPVNLTLRHFNESALTLSWDPPQDWGGRQEVTYGVRCEREEEAEGRWGPCPDGTLILPDPAELSTTSVGVSGLSPRSNYRLSVQAWNSISSLQGAPPPSTATITIHKWKVSGVTPAAPEINMSQGAGTAGPLHPGPPYTTVSLAALLCVLLVLPTLLAVVWLWRHHKFRLDQGRDLPSLGTVVSYHSPRREVTQPQQSTGAEGVASLLEGFSDRLLLSLKDVLVERDRLTLGKELGRGAFGLVYEGVFIPDEGVFIKVAVKTMRVGTHSYLDLEEFLREAELMRDFHHENVVRLLGVTLQREQDCAPPVPLVILPYMKHGDLRRFLIDTRYGDVPLFVPHQSLLRFTIDVAAGMEYLSSRGFLHRDLAARNCMLSDDLRVCVADFGLSKRIHSGNYYRQNSTVCVPIKWMAMESLAESIYTTKSDVWSFGVTMWEIVSRGRTPYPGVQHCELLDLLQSGVRLKAPPDCDQPLYEVMRSCWDEDPGSRPSFGELLQVLQGLLAELPELEASQEVSYINQVLEASAAAAASQNSPEPGGSRRQNMYLRCPAARAHPAELELCHGRLEC